jgi:23S rRNA pseudouridine1911/1915/1917 synthase
MSVVRESRFIAIPDGLAGERIDAALSRLLGLSRSIIVELLQAGEISLHGAAVAKSTKVVGGELLEVLMPQAKSAPTLSATPDAGLEIIYSDDEIVVINKPVGTASHPSPGWTGPTVIGGVIAAGFTITTSGAPERQGVVHRLDVGTSGLMVLAKNEASYSHLKEQFRQRSVHKVYHALVQGHMDPAVGTIDAPIDRHPKDAYRFAVVAGGKPSITHYRALEYFPAVSLLEITLETGRTHQIRVHFSALHHPLVGDLAYGADHTIAKRLVMNRPWLHAGTLSFTHPRTGQEVSFSAPYPSDLQDCLEGLRAN